MERLDDAAILFDLDGTLIDTAGDLAAAMNHVLASCDLPTLPTERVRHMVGFGAKAMLKEGFSAAGHSVAPEDLQDHVSNFLEYYTAHIDDASRPFPGAVAVIEALRSRGAKIAICTNKREAPAKALIEKLGLIDLFHTIVGGDTANAPKPDAAPVHLCFERCRRAHGVFIGDSDTDIAAATNANTPCLIASFGYGPLNTLDQAFGEFERYEEAPRLIDEALSLKEAI